LRADDKNVIPMVPFKYQMPDVLTSLLFAREYGYISDFEYPTSNSLDAPDLAIVYKLNDPKMNLVPWEQTPEFRDSLIKIRQWYVDGYTEYSYDRDKNYASVLSEVDDIKLNLGFLNDTLVKIFPLETAVPPKRTFYRCLGIAFNKYSQNPERTMMFLNWIQKDQKNYDLFMYGIKGKNYKLVNDKLLVISTDDARRDIYYHWDGSSALLNMEFERPLANDLFNVLNLFKESAKKNLKEYLTTGFFPNLGMLQTLIDNRWHILGTADAIPYHSIDIPASQMDEFINAYIAAQKKAGADNLTYGLQQQLDDWREAKEK